MSLPLAHFIPAQPSFLYKSNAKSFLLFCPSVPLSSVASLSTWYQTNGYIVFVILSMKCISPTSMFSKTKSGLLKKATRRSFNKSVEDAISSACCVRVSRGDSYHHLVIFFFHSQGNGRGRRRRSSYRRGGSCATDVRLPSLHLIHKNTTPHRTLVFTSHDTTSSTLAHLLHLLALHPKIQDRLREEIKDAKDAWERDHTKGDRDLVYDELNELPFLESVCRETLRL